MHPNEDSEECVKCFAPGKKILLRQFCYLYSLSIHISTLLNEMPELKGIEFEFCKDQQLNIDIHISTIKTGSPDSPPIIDMSLMS